MVYKDSAGKEIHEGDSLMDLTPGFVGEISEVFLDEDEGELAVNQDGTTIYLYEIDTEVNSLIVNEETMNIEKEEDDDEEKCAVIDTTIGVEPENLYRYHGTREECLVYIQEHSNEPNLGIIELEAKNVECSLVVGWSLYEPDEVIELTPSQAMDFHECLQELSDVDIRFNANGHSIENGSIRLSYNIYEHGIMVTRVWLNGKETKELVDTIQQWLDNNQDYIK